MSSSGQGPESVQWNPQRIFDQWETTFGPPPSTNRYNTPSMMQHGTTAQQQLVEPARQQQNGIEKSKAATMAPTPGSTGTRVPDKDALRRVMGVEKSSSPYKSYVYPTLPGTAVTTRTGQMSSPPVKGVVSSHTRLDDYREQPRTAPQIDDWERQFTSSVSTRSAFSDQTDLDGLVPNISSSTINFPVTLNDDDSSSTVLHGSNLGVARAPKRKRMESSVLSRHRPGELREDVTGPNLEDSKDIPARVHDVQTERRPPNMSQLMYEAQQRARLAQRNIETDESPHNRTIEPSAGHNNTMSTDQILMPNPYEQVDDSGANQDQPPAAIIWPGMHQQQAALAKAREQARQQRQTMDRPSRQTRDAGINQHVAAQREPSRPERSGLKRQYTDTAFQGYGEGYGDDYADSTGGEQATNIEVYAQSLARQHRQALDADRERFSRPPRYHYDEPRGPQSVRVDEYGQPLRERGRGFAGRGEAPSLREAPPLSSGPAPPLHNSHNSWRADRDRDRDFDRRERRPTPPPHPIVPIPPVHPSRFEIPSWPSSPRLKSPPYDEYPDAQSNTANSPSPTPSQQNCRPAPSYEYNRSEQRTASPSDLVLNFTDVGFDSSFHTGNNEGSELIASNANAERPKKGNQVTLKGSESFKKKLNYTISEDLTINNIARQKAQFIALGRSCTPLQRTQPQHHHQYSLSQHKPSRLRPPVGFFSDPKARPPSQVSTAQHPLIESRFLDNPQDKFKGHSRHASHAVPPHYPTYNSPRGRVMPQHGVEFTSSLTKPVPPRGTRLFYSDQVPIYDAEPKSSRPRRDRTFSYETMRGTPEYVPIYDPEPQATRPRRAAHSSRPSRPAPAREFSTINQER